jgi:hypothetical protein
MTDDLPDLDIEIITITCDSDGTISFDAGGISVERACWLMRSAEFLALTDHWYGQDDDETEED